MIARSGARQSASQIYRNFASPLLVLTAALWLLGCAPPARAAQVARVPRPRLILQITVDQFHADFPERLLGRTTDSGMDYITTRGIYFTNANYRHANTETAPGHTTLFTGATPAVHGIVANDWIDRASEASVYNIGDPRAATLDQELTLKPGVSPRNVLVPTLGDAIVDASHGKSRVFSVSVKDRGAVLPGGKRGKAFWFSKKTGHFVTSSYYYAKPPEWLLDWNARAFAEQFRTRAWELSEPREWYTFTREDDRHDENRALPHFGRVFPHPYSGPDVADKAFYKALTLSPAGDELVADFVEALLPAEHVGQGDALDLLFVSLSSTDYVGHTFGPDSLEAEDNQARLGQTLHRLLKLVDDQVGLKNTWIVLCGDHGGGNIPEIAAEHGEAAGRVDATALVAVLDQRLRKQFASPDPLVRGFIAPYVYLNEKRIAARGLSLSEVESAAARALLEHPGVERTFTHHQLAAGNVPDDDVARRVLNSFYAPRSGNVHVVEHPGWLLYGVPDDQDLSAGHGSPWAYDTHVPLVFLLPGLEADSIARPVAPGDIVPTLAALLAMPAPSGASGHALSEVLNAATR